MLEKIDRKHEERVKFLKFLDAGCNIVGAGAGGTIGLLLGGPAGAVVGGAGGAAISESLRLVGQEFSKRFLTKREEARAGGVLVIAAAEIQKRLENGDEIRQDGFFDQEQTDRSDADEVVENIVLKCQREPQEKKIRFMGYLIANLSFDSTTSADLAHQIINVADELTYRQLCLLRIAVGAKTLNLCNTNYRELKKFPRELYQILHECLDLYNRALINFGGEVVFGLPDIQPGSMDTQGLGGDIHNLMNLNLIPIEDMMPIIHVLRITKIDEFTPPPPPKSPPTKPKP